jgi:hypothetical protein
VYGHAIHLIDRVVTTFGCLNQVFCDVENVRMGEGLYDDHDIH